MLYSNAIKADNNDREDPKNGQISLIESSTRAVKDIMSTKVRTQHSRSVFSPRSLVLSFDFLPTCTRFRAHTPITDRRRFVDHRIIAMGIFWPLSESTEGRKQVLDAFPGLGIVSRCLDARCSIRLYILLLALSPHTSKPRSLAVSTSSVATGGIRTFLALRPRK